MLLTLSIPALSIMGAMDWPLPARSQHRAGSPGEDMLLEILLVSQEGQKSIRTRFFPKKERKENEGKRLRFRGLGHGENRAATG